MEPLSPGVLRNGAKAGGADRVTGLTLPVVAIAASRIEHADLDAGRRPDVNLPQEGIEWPIAVKVGIEQEPGRSVGGANVVNPCPSVPGHEDRAEVRQVDWHNARDLIHRNFDSAEQTSARQCSTVEPERGRGGICESEETEGGEQAAEESRYKHAARPPCIDQQDPGNH
jgi:hypothetical protein